MWSAARRAGASAARRAASASASTSTWSVPIRGGLLSPTPGPARLLDVARGFRILPAAHAAPLGAAAAAVGVRAAAGVAANAVKLRAARGAYASIFSDRARLRFRRLVFGGDATGSAARVALVASAGGTALYCLVEPVPVSGRRRLLLFGLDDEMAMGDVAAAELFAERAGAFLPPGDARVRRVAAVMWQLVNRLEPVDVATMTGAATEESPSDETPDPSVESQKRFETKKAHPLIDGARRWTVHVVDDASVDAYTVPGGHVFVHSGVLDLIGLEDDSTLAFILAHEMGHSLCRHGAEKATLQVLSSAADAASWAAAVLAGADYFGGAFTAAALAGAESAVTLAVNLPHSRDMEREADLVGVRLMARACFDPNGAARAFRKIQAARRLEVPGSPPGASAVDENVSLLEAYLSTHPLDDERVRNTSTYASALKETSSNERREALCASFRDAVSKSGLSFFILRASKSALPANANAANRGAVAAPSDQWRARFILDVDAKIAGSPRGVTGALGVAKKRAERGSRDGPRVTLGSGPVGRFDRGGFVAIVSGTSSKEIRRDDDETEESPSRAASTGRLFGSSLRENTPIRDTSGREPRKTKTVSLSRAWRGPVRRARETASASGRGARIDGGVGSEAPARRAAPGSGDAEAGETVLGGAGRLDRGARRAVRRVASRTTRRRAEL